MRARTFRSQGFTLIEVMVAMFIMAILAAMAWQGVDGIVNTRNASQARMEGLLKINTVLAQFEQDVNSIQDSGALPQTMPRFDGNTFTLSRRTPDGLQLVVWSLRGGTWMRWAGPAVTKVKALQDQWLSSQQFIGNEPGQLRTLTGLASWQCYCFRNNSWSNCQSSTSSEQGGSQSSADVLKGVRLVLSFGEGSGYSGNVTRQIALGPQ